MSERLALRPEEVAEAIGVHEETVLRWLRAGLMPGRKVRHAWFVSVGVLQEWLNGEAADGGRGESVSAQPGRPLGGADQQRSARRPQGDAARRQDARRSKAAARRAADNVRPLRPVDDGWRVPPSVA